jgi:hypothetical protein
MNTNPTDTNLPEDLNAPQPPDSAPFTWGDFRRFILPLFRIIAGLVEWATCRNLADKRSSHAEKSDNNPALTAAVQEMNGTLAEIREAISDLDKGGETY